MKEHTLDILTAALIKYGTRVFWAAVIVFVGLRIIRIARRAAGQIMDRAGVEITLKKFLDMLLHAVLFGVMVFMAADQLGIKTTSFVAVIGTVTLAFSLAMQNTLSNFAGGTLILLLKPFKVGDYISTSSGEGTVESIGLVYTTLLTTDNRVITIPNSSVSSAPLTNLTRTGKRRLIINVGIGYSSDLLKAKNVLKKIFEENPGIMKDQPVQVVVDALGDSSVVLSARGWTTCEDYWTAKWSITEAIKLTFDKEGIELSTGTCGWESGRPNYTTGNPAPSNEQFAQIKRIMENTPWFGNDDDEVDMLARKCGQIYSYEVEKYKNPRGGQFQAGCYPVSANVLFGKDVLALPDGRLAHAPLADGVSPRQGKDTNGPTAAAMSVAKLDHENYSNGTLYNQKFLPSALAGDEGLKRFAAVKQLVVSRRKTTDEIILW